MFIIFDLLRCGQNHPQNNIQKPCQFRFPPKTKRSGRFDKKRGGQKLPVFSAL